MEIIDIMIIDLKETLEEQGISIEMDKEAKEKIAELVIAAYLVLDHFDAPSKSKLKIKSLL